MTLNATMDHYVRIHLDVQEVQVDQVDQARHVGMKLH